MILTTALKTIIYTGLREIGLAEQEVELYALSLSLGPSSITEIAKHLKLSRPSVYKLIRSLADRGLATIDERHPFARSFMVASPTTVLESLRKKREAVSDTDRHMAGAMPDLLALYHQGATATKVRVIEGAERYLQLLNQSLDEEKREIMFFGSEADFVYFVSYADEAVWFKKRVRKGVKLRMLLLPGKEAEALIPNEAKELREVRILKGAAPFSASFQIFANKLVMWQPKAPLALLIEDEFLVQMMKSVYNTMWEKAV